MLLSFLFFFAVVFPGKVSQFSIATLRDFLNRHKATLHRKSSSLVKKYSQGKFKYSVLATSLLCKLGLVTLYHVSPNFDRQF